MKLIHGTQQEGRGSKPGSQFTGDVNNYMVMRRTDGVTINTVAFSPGARTYWHSHENGQILQVQSGEGFVATDADGVRILRPGDTVWCPPGERHWHGASPDTFLVHVAISLGQTSWAEEVTQGEYEDGTKGRDENDR